MHIRYLLALGVMVSLNLGTLALGAGDSAVPSFKSPGKDAIDLAKEARLTRHTRTAKGGAHTTSGLAGGAPLVLAIASLAGDQSADARLLEQMRYTITGGNDLTANGGYPAQHERIITAMYLTARANPRIWSQLSAEEIHKIDLLMKASFIGCAFTTSDNNPFIAGRTKQYSMDGDGNLNRNWNPNFREGMIGGVIHGIAWLGSPEKTADFLKNYDHEQFVLQLEEAGLSNLHETFTWKQTHPDSNAPTADQIEQAVRDYRLHEMDLSDPMALYAYLVNDTFGRDVSCGLNDHQGIALPDGTIAAHLHKGCEALPNRGQPGMLKEFDSVDANGKRSSTLYSHEGFKGHVVNHFVMLLSGLWTEGPVAEESLKKMTVGATDLFYKIENGYTSYAKGRSQGVMKPTDHGMPYSRTIWEDVVKPFHAAK